MRKVAEDQNRLGDSQSSILWWDGDRYIWGSTASITKTTFAHPNIEGMLIAARQVSEPYTWKLWPLPTATEEERVAILVHNLAKKGDE